MIPAIQEPTAAQEGTADVSAKCHGALLFAEMQCGRKGGMADIIGWGEVQEVLVHLRDAEMFHGGMEGPEPKDLKLPDTRGGSQKVCVGGGGGDAVLPPEDIYQCLQTFFGCHHSG